MHRNSVKLSGRHKAWLFSAMALLYVTGAGWGWFHYLTKSPDEFGGRLPVESWSLKIHGAAAMIILVLLGTLIPGHVRFAWHARRNRVNGAGLMAFLGFLIVSGYGLYYFGDERLRAWASVSHLWIGLALPAILVFHIWRGRLSAAQK
jgi:hypothetical protein